MTQPESHHSKRNAEPQQEVLGMPFAANHKAMWISDLGSHVFVDVNDAALRQYGYTRSQFLAMSTFDLRTATQPGLAKQMSDSLLQAPRTAESYMHHAKNGAVFAVAITSWQKFTFDGRPAELALARRTDSLVGGRPFPESV